MTWPVQYLAAYIIIVQAQMLYTPMSDQSAAQTAEHLRMLLSDAEIVARETARGDREAGRIEIRWAGQTHTFSTHLRRKVYTAHASRIEASREGIPVLVIADHVQPAAAVVLRERAISYIDAAGNCHIESPPLLLHVEGRKAAAPREQPVRAFAGEGLKVIFTLLLEPAWAAKSYRDLAQLSGVSHGVVQYTLKDLAALGYVTDTGSAQQPVRHLRRRPELIERWAAAHTESLRPKLFMGTYRLAGGDEAQQWRGLQTNPALDRWGGEPAAAALTGYLKPGRFTLYTRRSKADLMKHLRLLPSPEGSIDVLKTFWTPRLETELGDRFQKNIVPALLAYADLYGSSDPRNAEVARLLREQITEDDG